MSTPLQQRDYSEQEAFAPDLPAFLRRVFLARQIRNSEDLKLEPARLHPPAGLKGINAAVDLLREQLGRQGRILIVADFDADGATSCALILRALARMGFRHLDYIVPNRFEFGYGLTPEIVDLAAERAPDLIVTVDNGISSVTGVDAAHRHGIKVLITDHHLPAEQLPAAEAIVNPNQLDCDFPSKSLAGVGVAFYLMLALRARLRDEGHFTGELPEPNLASLLDLVALGTIADVVPLERNNRILVNEGLRRIRAGRCCSGILALLDLAGRDHRSLVAADLGFAVGPRLNAAGRLEDMALGIECLLTDDAGKAAGMAEELNAINLQRRSIEQDMKAQADQTLASMQTGPEESLPAGLCLYDGEWHQGVIGILASRLKEKLHRPVIIFADAGTDSEGRAELKGSARSVPGLHVRDALEYIAARNPGLVPRFGGHAMAAGLSLLRDDYERFSALFAEYVATSLGDDVGQRTILTDGPLSPAELSLTTAQLLRDQGPWGQGFPEPLFEGAFDIAAQRLVGGKHLKLVLALPGSSLAIDAIAFNVDTGRWPDETTRRVHLAYRLDINRFRGRTDLQLIVEHIQDVAD